MNVQDIGNTNTQSKTYLYISRSSHLDIT